MSIFGGKKYSLTSGVAFILTAVVAVAVGLCGGDSSARGYRIPKDAVQLNKVLTNEACAVDSLARMEREIRPFLQKWGIIGSTLCVMRNDSLLYAHSFGEADDGVPMEPGNIMRVASVSKLITAAGVMLLQDRGVLSLDDTVFGEGDLLEEFRDVIKDRRYYNITIRHLLMHSAGFVVRGADPLFATREMMTRLGQESSPSSEELIRWQLRRPLQYAPGTSSKYSNIGFLILTLLIERATATEYEDWINDNVLRPAGCYDCHLARNFYDERYRGEVRYHAHAGETTVPCFDGRGEVERCYGANDITALKGAGGWVMSVPELMRFVASVDGRPEVKDILSADAVAQMTAVTDSVTFGLGWNDCSEDGVWTRTGTLSSTSALIKYFPDGECWIFVTNTGTYRGPHFTKYVSTLFRRLREKYSDRMPGRNLFEGVGDKQAQ